jgi:hypothetical protein
MATKKRRILYVDATIQDDITKISLCDTQNNLTNIFELAKSKKIAISWIPRKINVIADKIVKLEPTVKIKRWYILDLFYKMLLKSNSQSK